MKHGSKRLLSDERYTYITLPVSSADKHIRIDRVDTNNESIAAALNNLVIDGLWYSRGLLEPTESSGS